MVPTRFSPLGEIGTFYRSTELQLAIMMAMVPVSSSGSYDVPLQYYSYAIPAMANSTVPN